MPSPQTLSEADRRLVAGWAAVVAERVLPIFESEAPDDGRAREAIGRARAFSRGELDVADEIRQRFVAFRAAQATLSPAAAAAAAAAAHAAAVAHMGAHALAAPAYAVKAITLSAVNSADAPALEVRWQIEHLTPEVRSALRALPKLGENSSGPLAKGLLSAGVLAETIRKLQDEVADK
jgi:hypothetical protein